MKRRTLNRLNDYFFKRLMGDDKRSDLTLRFLNLILNRTEENAFKKVEFLNPEYNPLTKDGKLAILDIKASVDDKAFVNIELQVSRQNYMPKRSMFYISRMISEQMVKGQDYETLKPVIGINLLDFSLFDDIDTWHNVARFKLDNTDKILTDCITMHFLELPKLKYSDIKKVKRLEAWGAYFSGRCSKEELEVLLMNEPLLQKAVSFERAFLNDDKMYREYQQREDAIREETTKFNRVRREAKAEGRAEEKIESAINFLKLGVDVNTVASGTGFSLDKVIEINRQLNK